MYFEKDYILHLIHEIIRTLIMLLLGKDMEEEKDLCYITEKEEIYHNLTGMIDNGEINSAENSLIEHLDLNDKQYLQLSLMFYDYLNNKEDSFLLAHDFSREEILDGVTYIVGIYGYGNLIEALTKGN